MGWRECVFRAKGAERAKLRKRSVLKPIFLPFPRQKIGGCFASLARNDMLESVKVASQNFSRLLKILLAMTTVERGWV